MRPTALCQRKGTEGTEFISLLLSTRSALVLAYFAITYTHRTTVVLWHSGVCDIQGRLCTSRVNEHGNARQAAQFINVNLCSFVLIPNISVQLHTGI